MTNSLWTFWQARRSGLRLVLALAGILVVGLLFTAGMIRREDRLRRDDLLRQTYVVARAIFLNRVQALDGNLADEQKPEYRRLKEQLMAAGQINPAWEWIYLMGRNAEGQIFFQLDSEAYDADDASPPGQLYEEATALLHGVFDARMAATEGPVEDRWGTWVSAFVPLADPRTGELVTVLGIDIEAGTWRAKTRRAGVVPALLTLTLMAILLAGFLFRGRQDATGFKIQRRWRKLEATLSVATGLALTLTASWLAHSIDRIHQKEAFTALAQSKTEHVLRALHNIRNSEIESLGRFFESSEEVTPAEFLSYAEYLNQIPEVHAWGWIPIVAAEDRPAFEQMAREQIEPDFHIWDVGPADEAQPAAAREVYYPLLYIEPPQARQLFGPQVGFDFGSRDDLLANLALAREAQLPVATDVGSALPGGRPANHILTFRLVRKEEGPLGFVMAVIKPEQMLQTVLEANLDRNPFIHLDLLELRQDAPPQRLATTYPAGEERPELTAPLSGRWVQTRPVLFAGKVYAVAAHPSPEFFAQHTNYLGWIVLLAGLSITATAAVMINFLAHRREDMEHLVDERTFELASAMRRFDLLARHNRTFTWEIDAEGVYTDISSVVEDVLGYAPRDLIGKRRYFDLHPAESRAEFIRATQQTIARQEAFLDRINPMVTSSGETVWVSTTGMPVVDDTGRLRGYQGTDTDITARKQAEDELARLSKANQAAAERYATLISASNTGAWEYHDDTSRVWVSPEYYTMLGRSSADFALVNGFSDVDTIWLNQIHPDDRDHALRAFSAYLKRPAGMYQQTFRMRHADGRWIWVLSRGRVLKDEYGQPTPVVLGTHIDISEAKLAEEALRESEQKYRTLFLEMLEGFAVHEILCDDDGQPVNYRFLAVNPAYERLTGLKADDLLGRTVLDVLPGTEAYWIDTFGRVALTGEPAFFQNYSAQLGKHFEVTAFRPAPNQFACIFSDISERVKAETELRESRRQYEALLANLPGMAYRCANDRTWTMDFVSDGCRELTGYAPDDLVGNRMVSYNDLVCPPYRDWLWTTWQQAIHDRRLFEGEYEITTRTGETKWVWEQGECIYDEQGNPIALEGFISDITDRKQSANERERLLSAIEQSGDTIVITDAGGAILYANDAFTKVSGYTSEEALGQNPRIFQSGLHDRDFYREMWQTLSAGRTWRGQIVNKRKDGTLYTEMVSISPVRDAQGRIVHFVSVKRDITRQLQDQEEKESLQAQLLQAQKMESIGRLAGGVAHDFNNMLQAILGYAEMGLDSIPPDQPIHSDLLEIQKAAKRSAALTRQLQAFARKQTANPRVLDLNEAIDSMSGMLRPLIGEGIEWNWKPGAGIGPIKIDPSHLDQVLTNLCINARDAIGRGGHITLATREVRIARTIRNLHGDIPPGQYVRLSVTDDGHGMTASVIEHIFEPFYTTKQTGKGTGLGLATVYGIVRQSQAAIRVLSQPDKGSTFQVYFPRVGPGEHPVAEDAREEADLADLRGSETILIVEDEVALLQTARRMLESLGYRILATSSPEEALRTIDDPARQVDLLLTDVIMPEMNGPAMVQLMLERRPDLPYLYMSGYTANLIAEHGVMENSPHLLPKPFTRVTLARKIREVLAAG